MRLPEQNLWQMMKKNKPHHVWAIRIENAASEGLADLYIAFKHSTKIWVELKVQNRPVNITSCVFNKGDIRVSQENFHIKAHSMGVPSVILARMDREFILLPGQYAAGAHTLTLRDLYGNSYITDNWPEIWKRLELYDFINDRFTK